MDACCAAPGACIYASCCPCCSNFSLRKRVLGGDITKYKCCQGYFDCCCCKAGHMGESSCPSCCLCLEVCCCPGMAISATRMYLMDSRNIQSDPCDRRLIRFNNCLQCISCICSILAIFISELKDVSACIRCIVDLVSCTVFGCMNAQVSYELDHEKDNKDQTGPLAQTMV